jgi:subtilisin family serine protease
VAPSSRAARNARTPRTAVVAIAAMSALLASALAAGTAPASAVTSVPKPRIHVDASAKYIVSFADPSLARYKGGVKGLPRTAATKGHRLNTTSTAAAKYRTYLVNRQSAALAKVGAGRVIGRYTSVFSGVAVELTASQAEKLRSQKGVLGVYKNEIRKPDSIPSGDTSAFVGLTGSGAWDKVGGRDKAGKNIVVGVIDTGIWPESKSFAAMEDTKGVPSTWHGTCVTGQDWTTKNCNNKIIGARYYVAGFGGPSALLPEEYLSPRDGDGHGSHTASTAAGDYGVNAVIGGTSMGSISGVAPAARIAVYKVCWNGNAGGCATIDSMNAIEDAINDGVDVMNFSISGATSTNNDPVSLAFFDAAAAGVFVATSAGNSGPTPSTVNHNAPWEMSVAAGTTDREGRGVVTLGDGTSYTGVSAPNAGAGPAPLVLSTNAGLPTATAKDARLCAPGALDPAVVKGAIVVCDRGVYGRTDKSYAVMAAGGVGMILANTGPNSLNADIHFVPTVHVDDVAAAGIKAYAVTPGATATLSKGTFVTGVEGPYVADFSSRGPSLVGDGDMIKPDIMAPGVDILAAVAPPSNAGRSFDFYSGTSMASPHIAGMGALMKQAHPDWSPMAIKSALMTSADQVDNKGVALDGTPFDYGSGQVNVTRAMKAGLVYDSNFIDWYGYLCATEWGNDTCDHYGIPTFDASDFNYASIAVGSLAGQQKVTRTVTQTWKEKADWVPVIKAPAGVSVSVSPSHAVLRKGQSATFTYTFTRTTATLGDYTFGTVTMTDRLGDQKANPPMVSQIAIRPVALSVPGAVVGTGTSGSASFSGTSGYAGTLGSTVAGLTAAAEQDASVSGATGGSFDTSKPAAGPHTAHFTVNVSAGTNLARFATFASDFAAGDDVDLFVYSAGKLVGASAGGTADEQVDLATPKAGTYDVYVDAYALTNGSATVRQFTWNLGSTNEGNLTVAAPSSVTLAGAVPVTASWSGLTAGQRYLGSITWNDGTNDVAQTLVRVDG